VTAPQGRWARPEYPLWSRAAAAIPFGPHVRAWHARYKVTFKPSYQETSLSLIDRHLVPFFGEKDLREISEADLLDYITLKLDAGLAPTTITTGLSIVRRVLNLAVRDELISRNSAANLGELMRRVDRRIATEVKIVESWSREEAQTLLRVAAEHEPRFEPMLRFLLSTGARRGEALGLQWADIDFDRRRILIRRAITKGICVTPKSGKARSIAMPAGLADTFFDLLTARRQEALHRGWPDVPVWVFCSEAGTPIDERNLTARGIECDAERRSRASAPSSSTPHATPSPRWHWPRDAPSAGWRTNSATPTRS
jgi:integrase